MSDLTRICVFTYCPFSGSLFPWNIFLYYLLIYFFEVTRVKCMGLNIKNNQDNTILSWSQTLARFITGIDWSSRESLSSFFGVLFNSPFPQCTGLDIVSSSLPLVTHLHMSEPAKKIIKKIDQHARKQILTTDAWVYNYLLLFLMPRGLLFNSIQKKNREKNGKWKKNENFDQTDS